MFVFYVFVLVSCTPMQGFQKGKKVVLYMMCWDFQKDSVVDSDGTYQY